MIVLSITFEITSSCSPFSVRNVPKLSTSQSMESSISPQVFEHEAHHMIEQKSVVVYKRKQLKIMIENKLIIFTLDIRFRTV